MEKHSLKINAHFKDVAKREIDERFKKTFLSQYHRDKYI